jgi:hypothetical protein
LINSDSEGRTTSPRVPLFDGFVWLQIWQTADESSVSVIRI